MLAELFNNIGGYFHQVFYLNIDVIVMVGLLGQALFTARFIVQWLASERAGKSVIPVSFWFLSIGGGGILFAYALYRRDPVFILGQGLGIFIYARNLMLIAKERAQRE
jgi:lipid-A-disaccharide synthase-like uncharacterized protein